VAHQLHLEVPHRLNRRAPAPRASAFSHLPGSGDTPGPRRPRGLARFPRRGLILTTPCHSGHRPTRTRTIDRAADGSSACGSHLHGPPHQNHSGRNAPADLGHPRSDPTREAPTTSSFPGRHPDSRGARRRSSGLGPPPASNAPHGTRPTRTTHPDSTPCILRTIAPLTLRSHTPNCQAAAPVTAPRKRSGRRGSVPGFDPCHCPSHSTPGRPPSNALTWPDMREISLCLPEAGSAHQQWVRVSQARRRSPALALRSITMHQEPLALSRRDSDPRVGRRQCQRTVPDDVPGVQNSTIRTRRPRAVSPR
jgi:hypothetical protein